MAGLIGKASNSISVDVNLAHVVVFYLHKVFVFSYPAGSLIKKLRSKNGLSEPSGAFDSQNFNPN